MYREIVLDTETTGLSPREGHRIVEIGCVELLNHMPTGKHYHQYINPERSMPEGAFKVHGLSDDFLTEFPTFGEVANDFIDFIKDAPLIIHNAKFDMGFLNAELKRSCKPLLHMGRAVDTVLIARQKFPGSPANLNALCKRFGIDLSNRELHGALLDSELLAECYLELLGGKQPEFSLEVRNNLSQNMQTDMPAKERAIRDPRDFPLSENEKKCHQVMLDKIENSLWKKIS